MSENSSEFLKRTCLICGCHTNQTINIYEPRSGPNIVQLIQAKFKFQPLNEDKYLCFSCNNWLINWHSLQALNSNDAESPSGTFRSHLNSGNVVQDEKSSGSKKQVAICRPIAQVKPRLLEVPEKQQQQQQQRQQQQPQTVQINKTLLKMNFNKRNFRWQLAKRNGVAGGAGKIIQKSMHQCLCGKYMVVRSSIKNSKKSPLQSPIKCRKCREFSRLKACYLRSIVQLEKELAIRETPLLLASNQQNLVIQTDSDDNETLQQIQTDTTRTPNNKSQSINQQQQQQQQQNEPQQLRQQYLPKPTIDGKVVSMLRRLGTTLSREPQKNGREHNINTTSCNNNNNNLPQIMSPTKPKASNWCRPLEEDEILVNFDSSISEVLPSLADQLTSGFSFTARKRLEFQISETKETIDLCNDNEHDNDHNNDENVSDSTPIKEEEVLKTTYNLPKGLSITLL